jgi:hypothetical protein
MSRIVPRYPRGFPANDGELKIRLHRVS